MPAIPGILGGIHQAFPKILPRIPGLPGPPAQPPPNPLAQRSSDVQKLLDNVMKKAANKGGMLRLVVHGAQIVCDKTIPAMTINQLLVPEPRPLAEGRAVAVVQDVQRGKNIKPWPCKCQLLPSGSDFLPCNYQPAGMWKPGIMTENCDANTKSPTKPRSKANQMGYNDGLSQADGGLKNLASQPQTMDALRSASAAQNISLDNLKAMSIIESTGNGAVGTNAFGYTGLMQMGQAAATDVGMPYSSLVGAGNVHNNAMAGAKYWNINASRMASGIPRDPLHMYLAHQQGAGGLNSLMNTLSSNPGAAMTRNQLNNIPGKLRNALQNPTQQDFYDYWKGKMEGIESKIAGGSGAPKLMGVPEIATHKCSIGGTIRIIDPGQSTKKGKLGGCVGLK